MTRILAILAALVFSLLAGYGWWHFSKTYIDPLIRRLVFRLSGLDPQDRP